MRRAWLYAFCVFLAGCQAAAERVPIMPLPEEGQPIAYADLVKRARAQASVANDSFYVDQWSELGEAATALERTAAYLAKASDVPPGVKATLATRSTELTKLCGQLGEAAKARDVKKSNEALRQINLKVRELRVEK